MKPPRNIKFKRARFMAVLAAMAAGLVGCASGGPYPLDTLSPKSDLTREILNLFKEVTILDSLVLAVVIGAMIGAMRERAKSGRVAAIGLWWFTYWCRADYASPSGPFREPGERTRFQGHRKR